MMLLMSESLTDRVFVEQLEEETIVSDDEQDNNTDQYVPENKAIIQFVLGNEVIRCIVKKMMLHESSVSITFTSVPSLPLRLWRNSPIHCDLSCGSYDLNFKMKSFEVTWDNVEGKQLCTIISKIEQHSRSSK